eukprot:gnl/MRDRNA2_/MRDRNA2_109983_c0_seq1.p1 gnl/MRDRNA2_/MRDRNA2_109983_c0~~gnl/MRDRNA2_/MRDRNA2_109983_c0_seq1.p1  ORF type:complete len:601 (+),score=60.53 gnl/MRDRNA2_/MRDRNA2_109983_c0_seq1:85-1887(+)
MPIGSGGYARPRAVLSSLKNRLGRLGFRRSCVVSKVPRASSQERPIVVDAWIVTERDSHAQRSSGETRGRATERSRAPARGASHAISGSESPTHIPGVVRSSQRSDSMEVCVCRQRSRSPPSHPTTGALTLPSPQSPAMLNTIAPLITASLDQAQHVDPPEVLLTSPLQTSSPRWANAEVALQTLSMTSSVSHECGLLESSSQCKELQNAPACLALHDAASSGQCGGQSSALNFGGTFGMVSDKTLSPLVFDRASSSPGESEAPPSRRQSSVSEPGAELSPGSSPPTTRCRSSKRGPSPYIDEAKTLFSEMLGPAQSRQVMARELLADMFNPNRHSHFQQKSTQRGPYSPFLQPPASNSCHATPNFSQETCAIPNQKRPSIPRESSGSIRKSRQASRLIPLNGRCKNFPPGGDLEGSGITPLRRPASVAGLRSVWQNTALGRIKILTPLLTPSEGEGSRRRSASVGGQTEAERSLDKAFEDWQESEIPIERSVTEAMQIMQDTPEFQRVTTKKDPASRGSFIVPHLKTTTRSTIHLRGSRTLVKTEQPYSPTSPCSAFPSWVMIEQILRGQGCACDNIVDQSHEFVVHDQRADSYCAVEC